MKAWDAYLEKAGPERRIQIMSWYNLRPPSVQAMMREHPPGSSFTIGDRTAWVVSYINPAVDYRAALDGRFFAHADCAKDH